MQFFSSNHKQLTQLDMCTHEHTSFQPNITNEWTLCSITCLTSCFLITRGSFVLQHHVYPFTFKEPWVGMVTCDQSVTCECHSVINYLGCRFNSLFVWPVFVLWDLFLVSGPPEASANHILHPSCLSVHHLHQYLSQLHEEPEGSSKVCSFISSSQDKCQVSRLQQGAWPTRLPPVLWRQLDKCTATMRLACTGGKESRRNVRPCRGSDRRVLIIASPQE